MDKNRIQQYYQVLSETVNSSAVPMFWFRDDKLFMFNAAFEKLSEYRTDELDGMAFAKLNHPDNKAMAIGDIHTPGNTREVKIFTWILITKSGSTVSLELRLTRFFLPDEDTPYYFGVTRQVASESDAENIFSEEREGMKLVLEASGQGMWEWDATTDTIHFSAEFYKMLGYSGREEKDEAALQESLIHPDDLKKNVGEWNAFIRSKRKNHRFRLRLRKKDGSYIQVSSRCLVTDYKSDGGALRIIGVARDIDAETKHRTQIEHQARQLIDYNFINSHELRAPLTSILGLTSILLENYSEEVVFQLRLAALELDEVIHRINSILSEDKPPDGSVPADPS